MELLIMAIIVGFIVRRSIRRFRCARRRADAAALNRIKAIADCYSAAQSRTAQRMNGP